MSQTQESGFKAMYVLQCYILVFFLQLLERLNLLYFESEDIAFVAMH